MPRSRRKPNKLFFLNRFPRYCEIQSYMRSLQDACPERVRVETVGRSVQGRTIDMIVIQGQDEPRDGLMIEAGAHAREWLSHSTALYMMHYIFHHRGMLNYMDYYILPCLNPDGYEYTHIDQRLWRKNMATNKSSFEENWGVDLNRNFPYGFGLKRSSSKYSSNMYRGAEYLSEPESRGLAKALDAYGRHIKLYISLHSYGSWILYPWGFTKDRIDDVGDLLACGTAAINAMKKVPCPSNFRTGSLSKDLYPAAGGTVDYARGIHGIKFSFAIELPKGGEHKFDPPQSRILPVARESLLGIKAMITYVYNFYKFRDDIDECNKFRVRRPGQHLRCDSSTEAKAKRPVKKRNRGDTKSNDSDSGSGSSRHVSEVELSATKKRSVEKRNIRSNSGSVRDVSNNKSEIKKRLATRQVMSLTKIILPKRIKK